MVFFSSTTLSWKRDILYFYCLQNECLLCICISGLYRHKGGGGGGEKDDILMQNRHKFCKKAILTIKSSI